MEIDTETSYTVTGQSSSTSSAKYCLRLADVTVHGAFQYTSTDSIYNVVLNLWVMTPLETQRTLLFSSCLRPSENIEYHVSCSQQRGCSLEDRDSGDK
ncbi:hypothetical protein STEG23_032451, partial [Scotinomys teguina]